jgi:hypothetical protein
MRELIDHNIYEPENTLIVCGSCLENMDKEAFEKIKNISDNIYSVCLEKIHMNMIKSKLSSILRVGKVNKLIFVTVDKSPHCIQLHYISNELKKIMNLSDIEIKNYVSDNGNLIEISPETISLSKTLKELSKSK